MKEARGFQMVSQRSLTSNNFPGCGPLEFRSFIRCGVSGQANTLYPISLSEHKLPANFKLTTQKLFSAKSTVVCLAGSRKNLDISRASRGYPRHKYSQTDDGDNDENIDDSDMLAPKLGPLFTFSSSPKSQVSGDPGPKEKEIVELFRKVQAKLREKAAAKEENNGDTSKSKDQAKDRTVESLLKLLRKHSSEEGSVKTSDIKISSEQNKRQFPIEDKSRPPVSPVKEKKAVPFKVSSDTRPTSMFRRRSPIPQMKFQPMTAGETPDNTGEEKQSSGDVSPSFQRPTLDEQPHFAEELGTDLELELDPILTTSDDDDDDEFSELLDTVDTGEHKHAGLHQAKKHDDLVAMKIPELRSLAKSRGIKGYSKMKKVDLVNLLSVNEI